jgi:hypothetical protein
MYKAVLGQTLEDFNGMDHAPVQLEMSNRALLGFKSLMPFIEIQRTNQSVSDRLDDSLEWSTEDARKELSQQITWSIIIDINDAARFVLRGGLSFSQ